MKTWKKIATAIYLSGALTVLQNCEAVIAQSAPAVEKCEEVIEEIIADWNNFLDPLSEPQLAEDDIYVADGGQSNHDYDIDQGPSYTTNLQIHNASDYQVVVEIDSGYTISNCTELTDIIVTEEYTISPESSVPVVWMRNHYQTGYFNCNVDIDINSLDVLSVTKTGSIDNKNYSVTFMESEQEYPDLTGSTRSRYYYYKED